MFLKTNFFKALSYRKGNGLPLTYWFWVCLRFGLTLLPQNGYIHPDEYFQNMEVISGDVFSIDAARTWEFNATFPVRNIFIPKLVFGPPYYLILFLNPFTKYFFNVNLRTPYFLLVMPRLFICFLSLINDFCLYKICLLYGQNYRNRLKIFASSYVMLIFCCRSFSNSFEMIFLSLLLLCVAECMQKSDKIIYHQEFLNEKYKKANSAVERVKLFKLKTHLPEYSLSRVRWIATLAVVGIFNRPTFIGFAFPPVFFWLQRGLGTKVVSFKDFNLRIFTLILWGLPSVVFMVIVDSVYYGYLTLGEIGAYKVSLENFVVTPLNFLKYNSVGSNLARHGLHPRWLHVLVNVPLLFNVLGICAMLALLLQVYRFSRGYYAKLPRIQSITGLMLFSFVTPVGLLSLFPHQEARFIIPVLLPLVYLHGNYLHSNETDGKSLRKLKRFLLFTWYSINILLTIFFGFIHQGGLYPFVNKLYYEVKHSYGVQTHVVTSHSYSLPTSLLQLDSTSKIWVNKVSGQNYRLTPQTFFYEYGSLRIDQLFDRIEYIIDQAEQKYRYKNKPYIVFMAAPCSLESSIHEFGNYRELEVIEEFAFFPHISTEALPTFPKEDDQYCNRENKLLTSSSKSVNLSLLERSSCFLNRFCLKMYKVSVSHSASYNSGKVRSERS